MNVLLTGATGFLGRHVLERLLEDPEINITGTTTDRKKAEKLPFFHKVNFIEADLSDASTNFPEIFGKQDLLIHLAWSGLPNYLEAIHIEENLVWNIRFIKSMIEAGLGNLCVTGTCLEYGMREGCYSESMPSSPDVSYAIAKNTLRFYIDCLKKSHDFSFKWLRLFYTYGEGQAPSSLYSQLVEAIKSKAPEFDMSGGEQVRDFLEVSELAMYIVKCAMQDEVTGIINCCSGNPIKVKDFVMQYLEENECTMHLNLGVYPYPVYEPMEFWGDTAKLERILDKNPG